MRDHRVSLTQIQRLLGEPAAKGDGFLLYQGDCLALMRELPGLLFPLTVTSPPYNIGKEYESPLPMPQYLQWCESWIAEVYRLTCSTGAFWLNLGYIRLDERAKAIPIPYLLWDRVPFHLVQEIVWHYGAGVAAKRSFSPRNEKFLWYVKDPDRYVFNLDQVRDPNVKYPNQKKNGKLKCNTLGKNPSDVWQFPKVTSGENRSAKERTPHPAQFPLAVIERIIWACSHPGDLLLDPFVGSGSLIEAALRTGRCCVGFEINPKYLQVASQRLDRYIRRTQAQSAQGTLFA
ncbi:MAG: site-specific DNA-methyltransferase [Planctomycetes bacterium]|nr:site-specific DNA-methyltransferase [Planctomycetota bacterium]